MKDGAIKNLMRECSALITEKTQEIYDLVPGNGNTNSHVMCITTYPSAKEELTGIYFEGSAGKSYEGMLQAIGIKREDLYMTYAVKYRPYAISERSGRIVNREVTSEEVKMFVPFLIAEIETIGPKVLLVLGDLAYSALMDMAQTSMPEYGVLTEEEINGETYQLILMPHPSERKFTKMGLTDEAKDALQKHETNPLQNLIEDRKIFDTIEQSETVTGVVEEMDEPEPVLQTEEKPKVNNVVYERPTKPVPKRTKNVLSGKHKVILVYGGSALSNDPSAVVAERVAGVLAELNVGVYRIDLYKNDYKMDQFFDVLAEADGLIMATTVEWFGIGGVLQTFLDKAYMSGQFKVFDGTYLFNIAISRHSYEREAMDHILRSWELLGGIEGVNLCASIASSADIETNNKLLLAIDKKAEDFYRVINQQRMPMPTSINENKVILRVPAQEGLPSGEQLEMPQVLGQEKKDEPINNQISFINNYDAFIEKQQQDIHDIANLFKEKLATDVGTGGMKIPELFEHRFRADNGFGNHSITWIVTNDAKSNFVMTFRGSSLKCSKGQKKDADVVISSNLDTVTKVTEGKLTIQRAFMTGEIKAKGNFTLLYKLDNLFKF